MKVQYNNLYTHFVFISYNRLSLIKEKNRDRIEKHITVIIKNNGCRLHSIYANADLTHMLISRSPNMDEETLATIITDSSIKFIYDKKTCIGNFGWQDSCSAFSISKNDVDKVCKYILNQKQHHLKQTFAQKYDVLIKFYQSK